MSELVQIGTGSTLAALGVGETGNIERIRGEAASRRRLYELGLTPGASVRLVRRAPLGDPLEIEVRGYRLLLRKDEARHVALGNRRASAQPYAAAPGPMRERPPLDRPLRVALVGNPNSGKSTLFNALTGRHVHTGNYPGITVSRTVGDFALGTLLDVPGCYSLHGRSPDEDIAAAELLRLPIFGPLQAEPLDVAIVVIDATAVERSAYLLLQILEIGLPVVCALNMNDEAARLGVDIDLPALQAVLGVSIIGVIATKRQGLDALLTAVASTARASRTWQLAQVPSAAEQWHLAKNGDPQSEGLALARFDFIDAHIAPLITRKPYRRLTDRVDALLTHPLTGTIALLTILFVIFNTLFTWSQPLMDAISAGFDWLGATLKPLLPDNWFFAMLTDGLLQGVGTVLAFLPQIMALLFFMTFLESLGYLSRAAFLIDRLMRLAGLNGKAFVPMLSGYACAVPAILSLRTLESERDRKLTMAVLPLTSCSARLPVYTLIIATMFPVTMKWHGLPASTVLLFCLYVVSAVLAMFAAGVIGRLALRGQSTALLIELPPYRMPAWRPLLQTLWSRAQDFLGTAGTTIVVLSCVMWLLLHFPASEPGASKQAVLEHSFAGRIGHAIEPAIAPLGFDWKIGVGLIGSFAAREVFVATMAVIHGADDAGLVDSMRADTHADGRPVYTLRTGLALLFFMMLACQCMSTLATVKRETRSWRFPMYMFLYMTALAYGGAFAINQL